MPLIRRSILAPAISAMLLASLTCGEATAANAAANGLSRGKSPDVSPQVSSCAQGSPPHWYGKATSGYGSTGTEATIWTWNNWSVAKPYNFSNEAVWIWDPSNTYYGDYNDDLEVGFYSGWLTNNLDQPEVGWTNGMLPYYSLYNGSDVYVQKGAYLQSDFYIYMAAYFVGSNDWAYVQGGMDQEITDFPINGDKSNLQNMEQGEVTSTNTWMGGGSGDSMTLYWLNYAGAAYPWQYLTICDNSPYWGSSSNGTDYFANGGY